jgi:hypothetical protein
VAAVARQRQGQTFGEKPLKTGPSGALNRFGWRATREIEEDEEDP